LLVPLLIGFESLVAGETCPAPVDVDARVRSILHLRPEQELSEAFVVERHESGLYVELRNADATVIGQRTLPVEGSCDELAQAAAVVLSAWLSDVHPDFAGALPPAPPPEPAPVAPVPEPPPPAPAPAPQLVAAPAPAPASSLPSPARRLELALGVGADLAVADAAEATFAASAVLVVDYAPPTRGWGLSGFTAAIWPRQLPLGPGLVDWWRWPLGIGPSLRLVAAGVRWDASAGPALGWLHFAASQFDRVSGQNGFEWGGFIRLRAASRGRAGVFLQTDTRFFPRESGASATFQGGEWRAPVPGFSLGLAAGGWLAP
jgi:hypothetical protein